MTSSLWAIGWRDCRDTDQVGCAKAGEAATVSQLGGDEFTLVLKGVRLALDDFGTGYSSLSHLVRFPIDVVKIDCSFVQSIETDGHAGPLIAALIALAHRLQLSVTAEGVETAHQEQFLRSEGCDTLQGYRFSRPVDVEALTVLLTAARKS